MTGDSDGIFVGRLSVVNTGRRRRWSAAEKARIVEESLTGHRQASATARRHDIPTSLLFRWRRGYREGRLGGSDEVRGFVPAVVMPDVPRPEEVPSVAPGRMAPGCMEIIAHGGRRVVVDAGVDAAALARVLDVLERR